LAKKKKKRKKKGPFRQKAWFDCMSVVALTFYGLAMTYGSLAQVPQLLFGWDQFSNMNSLYFREVFNGMVRI